jgi:arsenate reductase
MAEAFLRDMAGERFKAHSAGFESSEINPYTVRVMEEARLSLDGHYSKPLSQYMGKEHFGYLITVCADAEARCASTFPGVDQRFHWPFEDPAAFSGTDEEKLA